MTFHLPHNQLMLRLPDGRTVSIIQNGPGREGSAYGHADQYMCEVSVEGEEDVQGFLDLTELVHYLRKMDTTDRLSDYVEGE